MRRRLIGFLWFLNFVTCDMRISEKKQLPCVQFKVVTSQYSLSQGKHHETKTPNIYSIHYAGR